LSCYQPHHRRSRAARWSALLLALLSIWAFIFVLAPWLEGFEPIGEITSAVRESGIDASAYYYTEVEECANAERMIRHSIER